MKKYPDGALSNYLFGLDIGDKFRIKGPFPKVGYRPNMAKRIGMVAGGTGITPMLQILEKALPDRDDQTEFSLIYCNQTPEDILLRDRLDDLAERYHKSAQHNTSSLLPLPPPLICTLSLIGCITCLPACLSAVSAYSTSLRTWAPGRSGIRGLDMCPWT